jgi:hypothetical protein
MNRRVFIFTSIFVAVAMIASGCATTLDWFGLGPESGAGDNAWMAGKLSFTTSNNITNCHDATVGALKDLDLMLVSDQTDKLAGRIRARTSIGKTVVINMDPLGGDITKIGIRMGYIGDKVQSEKIADRIKKRLR